MKKNVYGLNVGVCLALAFTTVGCVDHDYDLSEDIDLTVNVGGESFTIPKSSTDLINLSQILSLDEGSSIKAVAQGEYGLNAGDYVLVQSGNPTNSDFHIGDVTISNLSRNNRVETDEIKFTYPSASLNINEITLPVPELVNTLTLSDDNVTSDLVSLSRIGLDASVKLQLSYSSQSFTGTAYIKEGYTITFDSSWHVETTSSFIDVIDNHIVRFNRSVGITSNAPIVVDLSVTEINLTNAPAGEGLYAPGHFNLNSTITSQGSITIGDLNNMPAGTNESLKIAITSDIMSARITSITGVVNPSITINNTRFDINDIPDFLQDNQNSLDVDNPRFYLTVSNNSPVKIELNAQLESFKDGQSLATARIGAANGTAPVIIGANGSTTILISQKAISDAGANNIVVPNLSELIKTIPDYMVFEDIRCKVVQDEVTLALAPTYSFNTDYEAVIPLSFGADMRLHYTHEETDWDVDDMQKYNFNEVQLTFSAISTIPLSMKPQVVALDANGNEINDVTATVDGNVAAGTISAPVTSPIKVTLKSNTNNLKRLDGVRLIFDAVSDSNHVGDNLNEAQSLKFTDITLNIIGGVTIDLN